MRSARIGLLMLLTLAPLEATSFGQSDSVAENIRRLSGDTRIDFSAGGSSPAPLSSSVSTAAQQRAQAAAMALGDSKDERAIKALIKQLRTNSDNFIRQVS